MRQPDEVRAISLRRASKQERTLYAKKTLNSTGTNWERVKREAATDVSIDDQIGLCDPNDTAAVAAYWRQATVTRGRGRPAVAVKRPTLNMRVDADVLDAFKATGPGCVMPWRMAW